MKPVSPLIQPGEAAKSEPREPDKQNDVVLESEKQEASKDIENFVPLDKFAEDNKKPYTVDYLGIYFYPALTKELDVLNIKSSVQEIENFVLEEIKNRHLTSTIGSYKEVMEDIKESLEMSENEQIESKVERLMMYIKLMEKQRNQRKIDEHLKKTAIDLKTIFKEV